MPAASRHVATGKRPSRASLAPRKAEARSRVSNGAEILPGVDQRSAIARRYRDIASAIVADQGGLERCSEARLQLIRRFAAASVLSEQLESRLANGQAVDVTEFSALASAAVRIAQRIGVDRRAKTITPSLHDYIDGRATEIDGDAT